MGENAKDKKGSKLVSFSDVKATPVRWLWLGYLPQNKVSYIVGDAGCGKTPLALTLAALLSTGRSINAHNLAIRLTVNWELLFLRHGRPFSRRSAMVFAEQSHPAAY